MWPNPQETADLVTFSEEILTGKLHFLCSVDISKTTKTMTKTANSREKNPCEISLNKFKEKFQLECECRSFSKITPCEIWDFEPAEN